MAHGGPEPHDIDLLSPEALRDPHAYLRAFRDHDPVQWSARHHAWIVTGHPELLDAFRDPVLSSERMPAFRARLSGSRLEALQLAIDLLDDWMLFHDPPVHTRLRAPFTRVFTPKTVRALEDDVRRITAELLDAMEAAGEVDLVDAFTHPLPAAVIARLFGVPDELRDWLKEWSGRIGAVVFGATRIPDYEERARAAGAEFHEIMGALLEQRRREPRDDLLSALVALEGLEDGLDWAEILGAVSIVLFAGHDTTSSLLGAGTLALLDDPASAEQLRAVDDEARGPDGRTGAERAVEELLRFEPPPKAMMRVAREDHAFAGKALGKGDAVFLAILAGNRDPRVFPEPDRLDLGRNPNPHVTFGHGHHFCVGAPLARLEARIAMPALLRRFPDLRVAGDVGWKPNISDRSPAIVPVRVRR